MSLSCSTPPTSSYLARYLRVLSLILSALLGIAISGCDAVTSIDEAATSTVVAEDASNEATPTDEGCVTGTQSSGARYEVCLPDGADGDNPSGTLVIYSHGLVIPLKPPSIPETEGGIDVKAFVTSQGFAYAATSFYTNGLVDPPKGVKDLRELLTIYKRLYGQPERVLLLGFSNGALLATHALERHPGLFDGAFASCGVHGSYTREVDYLADLFVVFEHFFPDALYGLFGIDVGGPEGISPAFLAALEQAAAAVPPDGVSPDAFLAGYLAGLPDGTPGVLTHPDNLPTTLQLLGVIAATPEIRAAAGFDPTMPQGIQEGVETVVRAVAYNVLATNNVLEILGGHPYENTDRVYVNPFDPGDAAGLNASIARYEADPGIREQLRARYETSGRLRAPVVALHTPRDPTAPVWQEDLYLEKLRDPALYELRVVEGSRGGYGHCTFTPEEVGSGFDALLRVAGAPALATP